MKTALIYNAIEELVEIIYKPFNLKESIVGSLHKNVMEYYNRYHFLSSDVKNIEQKDYSKIFIQAEHISFNIQRNW